MLLSSLSASWEVFCKTFANNCPKLNLDETIGQVLTEDIRQKSMGSTIDDSAEAHNLTESIDPFNRRENKPRELDKTPLDQEIGKTDNDRSRGIGDQVFSALIAERLVMMFPILGRSREGRTVDDSSGIKHQFQTNYLLEFLESILFYMCPFKTCFIIS